MGTYEVALVLLVDPSGAILMQHRDEHAEVSPNKWGLPGGLIEDGETPEVAARRELLEETGLTAGELHPLWTGPRPHEPGFPHTVTVHSFYATTEARQEDVVLGEGQAMVFVPADQVLARDLGPTVVPALTAYLQATVRKGTWIVWRQGDDGNPFEVDRFGSREEADELAAALEARGHRQIYWVAAASR